MRIDFNWRNAKGQRVPCQIDLEIDYQALGEALGWRAMRNKHKQSRLVNGLVKGKVVTIGHPRDTPYEDRHKRESL